MVGFSLTSSGKVNVLLLVRVICGRVMVNGGLNGFGISIAQYPTLPQVEFDINSGRTQVGTCLPSLSNTLISEGISFKLIVSPGKSPALVKLPIRKKALSASMTFSRYKPEPFWTGVRVGGKLVG